MTAIALSVFALGVAGILGGVLLRRRRWVWEQRLIATIMPPICRFLGDLHYEPDGPGEEFVTPFESLGILGSSNRRKLRHRFTGRYRNKQFRDIGTAYRIIDRLHGA